MSDRHTIAIAALTLIGATWAPLHVRAEDARTAAVPHGSSTAESEAGPQRTPIGISANPAAVEETTGTGWLGRQLGLKDGWTLGGNWIGAGNDLFSGGLEPGLSFSQFLTIDLRVDLERTHGLKGSSAGIQFFQLNSGTPNDDAGTIIGYNTYEGQLPLHRSAIVQLWWRQALFDDKLNIRVGKSNPGSDFGNVVRPIELGPAARDIGTVSDLLWGPLYSPATFYGVFPGFYETAFGLVVNWAPSESFYAAYGVYDGNQARGVATGLTELPEFNGYYFNIAEFGFNWELGPERRPGNIGFTAYRQTGEMTADNGKTENGATGFYIYGSQQIWYRDPEPINNAGISAFYQLGWNYSVSQPFNFYVGSGLTFRGLVESRPKDSFGVGVGWGRLNPNQFENYGELITQAYYQAHVAGSVYAQSALSYMPNPGAAPGIPAAWAVTQTLSVSF